MKFSLAWVFDHLQSSIYDHDVPLLMKRFTTTTAAIESWQKVVLDPELLTLAQVTAIDANQVQLHSPELKVQINLPLRTAHKGQWFLLARDAHAWRWAFQEDFYGTGQLLLPAFASTDDEQVGTWKKQLELQDYIFEIDNISLTHRPDLWGHRGIAREIGALLQLSLVDEQQLLAPMLVEQHQRAQAQLAKKFSLEQQVDWHQCKRFAVGYVPSITMQPSSLWMTHRLLRVEGKPINAVVDATNYVMFDWGQPMHAFDANLWKTDRINIKYAAREQSLLLLDEQEITLQKTDLVVADGDTPVALAGIMGGATTAVHETTSSLFIEAANFDATIIRSTAAHHKLRTQASTRFEKQLDQEQVTKALQRFLFLLNQLNLVYQMPSPLVCLGAQIRPTEIVLEHVQVQRLLGATIPVEFVEKILSALGFLVKKTVHEQVVTYCVQVPSFRAKDVVIPADLIEEIGRFFGYDTIKPTLPALVLAPTDQTRTHRLTAIRQFCAYAAQMHELRSYALYHQTWLQQLSWQPKAAVSLKNPVAETMSMLVTSLIPQLMYAVVENRDMHQEKLNFFEINKVWHRVDNKVHEQLMLAMIFVDTQNPINFYKKKSIVQRLFDTLEIEIDWTRTEQPVDPWYHPYQTAALQYQQRTIGFAGIAQPQFIMPLNQPNVFLVEIELEQLLQAPTEITVVQPLAKYQDVWRDISLLVPVRVQVAQLVHAIEHVADTIVQVRLLDFFQKPEWQDQRSVTLRVQMRNATQLAPLSTEQLEQTWQQVTTAATKLGGTIR